CGDRERLQGPRGRAHARVRRRRNRPRRAPPRSRPRRLPPGAGAGDRREDDRVLRRLDAPYARPPRTLGSGMTTLTIVALLPGLQNTTGDAETAHVLARRAGWAGLDARVVAVESRDDLPDRVDAVVLGSGSDSSLEASRTALLAFHDERGTWGTRGVP